MNANVFIGARGDGVQDIGRCDLEELANLNKFKVLFSRLKKRGPLKELRHFHILGGLIERAAFVTAFKEGNDLEILSFFFEIFLRIQVQELWGCDSQDKKQFFWGK